VTDKKTTVASATQNEEINIVVLDKHNKHRLLILSHKAEHNTVVRPRRPGTQTQESQLSARHTTMSMLLLPLLVLLPAAAARNSVDTARLGNSKYSTMPLSRASGGTNSVSVRVGTPPQTVNLTACK
jgi:hypothetical protein